MIKSLSLIFFIFLHPVKCRTSDCSAKNKNETVIVAQNDIFQDSNWWYRCTDKDLVAQGCVVNGRRYNISEEFLDYLNNFYGVCEALGGKYLRTTILGCIDSDKKKVEPSEEGEQYLLDENFWANCTEHQKKENVPGLGEVDMNTVSREIIGCNDGTYQSRGNGDNFVLAKISRPVIGGIGVACRLNKAHPFLEPLLCAATNSTQIEVYPVFGSGCYVELSPYLCHCLINKTGEFQYSWELGCDASTPENVAKLESQGYSTCTSPKPNAKITTQIPTPGNPNPSPTPISATTSTLQNSKPTVNIVATTETPDNDTDSDQDNEETTTIPSPKPKNPTPANIQNQTPPAQNPNPIPQTPRPTPRIILTTTAGNDTDTDQDDEEETTTVPSTRRPKRQAIKNIRSPILSNSPISRMERFDELPTRLEASSKIIRIQ